MILITVLTGIVVYVVGWITFAAVCMRTLANRMEGCIEVHNGLKLCGHDKRMGHWRGDGTVGGREILVASLAALGWPVLWMPALAFVLATRRPTPRSLQNRIAELEREVKEEEEAHDGA